MSGSLGGMGAQTGAGFSAGLPNVTNQTPNVTAAAQNFQNMTPEQLQEAALKYGPQSQVGQLAQRVLMQKRLTPQVNSQQNQQQAASLQSTLAGNAAEGGGNGNSFAGGGVPKLQIARKPVGFSLGAHPSSFGGSGGFRVSASPMLPKFDMGGGMSASQETPWWTRASERDSQSTSRSGFLASPVPGRTDHIPASPAANSYVIPADVVSGIGEGNSLAGARFLQSALSTGPHGVSMPSVRGGGAYGRIPPPPRVMPDAYKDGGHTDPRGGVKAMLAGGEFVVSPEQCAALGGGDPEKGHRILDKFVVAKRREIIAKMRALKPPVGSKKS